MLKINNVELEFDLLDSDIAEKFEKAIKNLQRKERNKNVKGLNMAQVIRLECHLIFDFFNELFGAGTDKKIFGNKTNYRECEKAFEEVVLYAEKQSQDLKQRVYKYNPNRAERRKNK